MHRKLALIILSILVLHITGCQHDAKTSEPRATEPEALTTPVEEEPAGSKTPEPPMPTPEDISASEEEGPEVTLEGTLEMARLPSGKRFQPTYLIKPDGKILLFSYRPMPEHFHLVGQKVSVTGRHKVFHENVQSVGGDHFTLETIEPIDRNIPIPELDAPPRTPLLTTLEQGKEKLDKRWVHVHGTFKGAKKTDGSWLEVSFVMKAGGTLFITLANSTYEREWKAHEGKKVTVTGELYFDGAKALLTTPVHLCEGHQVQCLPASSSPGKKMKLGAP